jgi:hypothetical protein
MSVDIHGEFSSATNTYNPFSHTEHQIYNEIGIYKIQYIIKRKVWCYNRNTESHHTLCLIPTVSGGQPVGYHHIWMLCHQPSYQLQFRTHLSKLHEKQHGISNTYHPQRLALKLLKHKTNILLLMFSMQEALNLHVIHPGKMPVHTMWTTTFCKKNNVLQTFPPIYSNRNDILTHCGPVWSSGPDFKKNCDFTLN